MEMEADAEMHGALAIPEIMEHILQYCSKKDLLACRLVSKSWSDAAVTELRSKVKIILLDGESMSQFLDCLKATGACPKLFANFLLSLDQLQVPTEFWSTFAESVKILELSHCQFLTTDALRTLLFQRCPNMKELSMEHVSVMAKESVVEPEEWTEPKFGQLRNLKCLTVDHRASKDTGISWMEYFNHFSSLEVLKMSRLSNGDQDMFGALVKIRKQFPSKLKLKQLDICYHNTSSINPAGDLLGVLLDPGLHLESLVLCVNRDVAKNIQEATTFSDILSAHPTSLKTLELNCGFRDNFVARVLPFSSKLDNFPAQLERLHQATFLSTSIESLNFLKFTPNLSKLLVKPVKQILLGQRLNTIENTDFGGMGHLKLAKLETLELNFYMSCSLHKFRSLMSLMPNVKRLKMPLNNRLFELMCQRWQKLEQLEIVRGCVNASGITGFDVGKVDFRCSSNNTCVPGTDFKAVPRANITYLTELRILSLEAIQLIPGERTLEGHRSIWLNHWAAHLGIERLPQLQHLQICNYNMVISCGIWKSLLKRYPWPEGVTEW